MTTKPKGGFTTDFKTSLRLEECISIFSTYLEVRHGAQANSLKIKNRSKKGGHAFEWKELSGGKSVTNNGYIIDNIAPDGSSYPVMILYSGGQQIANVNVMSAIYDLDGRKAEKLNIAETQGLYYQSLIAQRFHEYAATQRYSTEFKSPSNADKEKMGWTNKTQQVQQQTRDDFLYHTPSIAVAQLGYLLAQIDRDPLLHQNQKVKEVNQHPYSIDKKLEVDPHNTDIFIVSERGISNEQILDFVRSDHFIIPKNDFNITKEDVIQEIQNRGKDFSYNKYFSEQERKEGVMLFPSMNSDGVITNIQKVFSEKKNINGNLVNKIFLPGGVVDGSNYVFNHQEKLKADYKPKQIIVTEGWATGRTFNNAIENNKDAMVNVCWNAGQINNTVSRLLKEHPQAIIMIAADNDWKSFYKLNQKAKNKLELVRNTGLHEAAKAYVSQNEQDQKRIGILIPKLNYKKENPKKLLSDFNDIELERGVNTAKLAIFDELKSLENRKQNNISEIDRVVNMYNKQALHYSSLYQLPVRQLDRNAERGAPLIAPKQENSVADLTQDVPTQPNTQNKPDQDVQAKVDTPTPSQESKTQNKEANNQTNSRKVDLSIFDAPPSDTAKTEFQRKIEVNLNEIADLKANPKSIVINTISEPKIDAPAEQPIANPADFTLILYHSSILKQYTDLVMDKNTKEEMLNAIEDGKSLNETLAAFSSILDDTVRPHANNIINDVLEKYQDTDFYADLVKMQGFVSEQFIKIDHENTESIKALNNAICSSFEVEGHSKGLDNEVKERIEEINTKGHSIENKREFFKTFRNALQNLNDENSDWIKEVNNVLNDALTEANSIAEQKNKNSLHFGNI